MTHLLSYCFCVRNGLTGWFWPRVFYEVAVRDAVTGVLPGARESASRATHLTWRCRRSQFRMEQISPFAAGVSSPRGSWLSPQSERSKTDNGRVRCAFYNLVTNHHFYTGITKSSPHLKRGELSSIFCGEEFCVEKLVYMF